ncbi:MAG: hypothetical protein FJX20_00650 [Alphaproteobacteria bacterium]|nr:hypothetical protein [Alphaproteobacteria bacterium]
MIAARPTTRLAPHGKRDAATAAGGATTTGATTTGATTTGATTAGAIGGSGDAIAPDAPASEIASTS